MAKKNLQISVYKAEAEDGLSKIIRSNASVAYYTKLEDTKLSQEVAKEIMRSVSSEEEEQFDLFYLNTVLVTTGWNKNFDVFANPDTWAARYTPIHKQFNLGHDQSRIIGHMTSSKAVNEKFEPIPDDVNIDELPAKFHILTGAVIYRVLEDEEAQASIEKIIEEIGKGEWYVSMECLFRNFDYGVISPEGEKRIIARNEDTAFLTKHLRQYGGTGKYNNFEVGRVLRNITFSGKGLVRNPANPESIIFNDNVASFSAGFANLGYINSNSNASNKIHNQERVSMADQDNTQQVKLLENQLAELRSENKNLTDKVKEFESSVTTAKITSLEADVKVKDQKITQLQEELTQAQTKWNEQNKELIEAKDRATKAEASLASVKAEQVKANRVASLLEKNAPKEEADKLVALFNDKNDADFLVIAELFAPKWVKKTEEVPAAKATEEKPKAKPKVVDSSALDDVEEEDDDTPLAVGGVDEEVEPLRDKMASVFASILGHDTSDDEE